MHSFNFSNTLRGAGLAALICGFAFVAGPAADAKPKSKTHGKANDRPSGKQSGKGPPSGKGNPGKGNPGKGNPGKGNPGKGKPSSSTDQRGQLQVELHRGAVVAPGVTTIATPNYCTGKLDLAFDWDETSDRVRLRLFGKNALTPNPTVVRPNANFRQNIHAPEQQNVENGEYRLWIIGAAGPISSFYYDNATYELLGGGPGYVPPNDKSTTQIEVATHYMFPTPAFQPSKSGQVKFDWTFSFSEPPMGEDGEHSYYVLAYVPPNLCEYDPFRSDLTTYIPYMSGPVSRDEARPFSDYLRGGMMFDVTVQPSGEYGPANKTSLSTYSNATVIAGGVPPDWCRDFDAAMAGLAPPIIQWSGANRCQDEFAGFHDGENRCTPG